MNKTDKKQTILITGASIGLGKAIAQELLKTDHHLILTARESSLKRFDEIGITQSDRIWLRPLDITDENQRIAIVEEANEKLDGIDCLINNAGISYRSVVEHVTEEERMHQMSTNFRGPMELVRLCLPKMREKRHGRIINISSVGGMMAMPTMALYSASKFALEGASESLYYEVKPWGIFVTLIEPGFISSNSFQKTPYTILSKYSSENVGDPYHEHYYHMERFIAGLMTRSFSRPSAIARRVIKVMNMKNPPLRCAGTPDALMFDFMRRFLPRKFYHFILYRSLPGIKKWGPQ